MHMHYVLSNDSNPSYSPNDKIPNWLYQMIISMGIAVLLVFGLILAGSIFI